MSIVTVNDFIGEINLPNTDKPYVQENIQIFIDKYETEFLDRVFGVSFANDFVDGLNADPVEQRWLDLLNGKVYQYGDIDIRYLGVKQGIVDYIYFWITRDRISLTGDTGENRTIAENSNIIDPTKKQVRAWNEMCDLVYGARAFVTSNSTIYPPITTWKRHWLQHNWWLGCGCYGWKYRHYEYFDKINTLNV